MMLRRLHLNSEAVAGVALIVSFVFQITQAGQRSYWYDELLSVYVYGESQPTFVDMITSLASKSIHPPLYYSILYPWMSVFGSGETSTRVISSLFMLGAGVALWFLAERLFKNARAAAISVCLFAFSFTCIRFGMETRSYALTVFLTMLSSIAFLRLLDDLRERLGPAVLNAPMAALVAVNTLLWFTHYFNAFFLMAQGIFFLGFLLVDEPRHRGILKSAGVLLTATLVPLFLFVAFWGPIVVSSYQRFTGGRWSGPGGTNNPFTFLEQILALDFSFPVALMAIIVLSVGLWAWRSRLSAFSAGHLYLATWLILPLVIAAAVFSVTGESRFAARYFIFAQPAVILAVSSTIVFLASLTRLPPAAIAVVVFAVFALSRSNAIVSRDPRYDGDIADRILAFARTVPDATTWVYEAGDFPTFNHYLSGRLSVRGNVTRQEEEVGVFAFERSKKIPKADYFIVIFSHTDTRELPVAYARLQKLFPVQFAMLSRQGRGFIVLRPPKPQSAP